MTEKELIEKHGIAKVREVQEFVMACDDDYALEVYTEINDTAAVEIVKTLYFSDNQ